MPKATKRQESEYRLPEGEYFPVSLKEVEEVEIEYQAKDRNGNKRFDEQGEPVMRTFTKWRWIFEILDGNYKGEYIFGDSPAEYTTREDNLVRQWSEVLMGKELELGAELDTDLLIGLEALVSIRHGEPRRKANGEYFYPCEIEEFLPRGDANDDMPF